MLRISFETKCLRKLLLIYYNEHKINWGPFHKNKELLMKIHP